MDLLVLPAVNATLNATSAVLLVSGWIFIKRKAVAAHKACMLTACGTSTLFLASYLTFHFFHGSTHFQGEGLLRQLYFGILLTHTLLAIAVLPLVITTLIRAFKGQFNQHVRIARLTFPIWLYVSITGVVVYWMLYQLKF